MRAHNRNNNQILHRDQARCDVFLHGRPLMPTRDLSAAANLHCIYLLLKTNVLQGNVVTRLGCGRIFKCLIANFSAESAGEKKTFENHITIGEVIAKSTVSCFYRASACLCMQSTILLWQICLSIYHTLVLYRNE